MGFHEGEKVVVREGNRLGAIKSFGDGTGFGPESPYAIVALRNGTRLNVEERDIRPLTEREEAALKAIDEINYVRDRDGNYDAMMGDQRVANIFRGGIRGYEWTVYVDYTRAGKVRRSDQSTLGGAKEIIQIELEAFFMAGKTIAEANVEKLAERQAAEKRQAAIPSVEAVVDMTPSWRFATRVAIEVLKNPEASFDARVGAEEELMRLAAHVDKLNAKGRN